MDHKGMTVGVFLQRLELAFSLRNNSTFSHSGFLTQFCLKASNTPQSQCEFVGEEYLWRSLLAERQGLANRWPNRFRLLLPKSELFTNTYSHSHTDCGTCDSTGAFCEAFHTITERSLGRGYSLFWVHGIASFKSTSLVKRFHKKAIWHIKIALIYWGKKTKLTNLAKSSCFSCFLLPHLHAFIPN